MTGSCLCARLLSILAAGQPDAPARRGAASPTVRDSNTAIAAAKGNAKLQQHVLLMGQSWVLIGTYFAALRTTAHTCRGCVCVDERGRYVSTHKPAQPLT